jgi:hypothetical protein
MTITLEAIKAEQSKISEMIAAFEKQAASTEYHVDGATIILATGERYAGLILGENGEADYHLILLPGEVEDVTWEAARKWADEHDASLPTRREQSLLYANLKGEFKPNWYWSGEEHADNSGWAWSQNFYNGYQDSNGKSSKLRARAVRRFIPSVI